MTTSPNQISKIPATRRQQAEQAVARLGVNGAIAEGWTVDEVRKAVDRINTAHGEADAWERHAIAAAETAAKYSKPHRQYVPGPGAMPNPDNARTRPS